MTTSARSQSAFNAPPAKLSALPTIRVTDPQMARFVDALRNWVDARSGARDPYERAVTMRDLVHLGLIDQATVTRRSMAPTGAATPPSVLVQTPSGVLTMSTEAFAKSIYDTALFRDMVARIDDPARFDRLPDTIKAILLRDIADEAAARGADIRRLESRIQNATQSLAYKVDETTAAFEGSLAGVRETTFAVATESRATAGQVTQVEARLDGFDGGAATVEETMTAVADRATGLEAQYTLKVTAGSAVAGFGLAATTSASGNATSAMIVMADKFAIVGSSDTIADPLNPPADRVPFGVDTINDTIYINGQVRINTGTGTALEDLTPGLDGDRGSLTGYGAVGSAAWSSLTALNVIESYLGITNSVAFNSTTAANLRIGDTVTLTYTGFAETRYWGGVYSATNTDSNRNGWYKPGVIINGNLLVDGTIATAALAAGTITAAISMDTNGYINADGAVSVSVPSGQYGYGKDSAVAGNFGGTSDFGVAGGAGSSTGAGVYGFSGYTGLAAGVVGEGGTYGVIGYAGTTSGAGVYAVGHATLQSFGLHGITNNTVAGSAGVYGVGGASQYGVYGNNSAGTGVYGYSSTFRGVHAASGSDSGLYAYSSSGAAIEIGTSTGAAIIVNSGASYLKALDVSVSSGAPITCPASSAVCTNLNADLLDGQHGSYYQTALGFSPVQKGTGTGQGSNEIKVGWNSGSSSLYLSVDSTNHTNIWPINVSGQASATLPVINSATMSSSAGGGIVTYLGNLPTGVAAATAQWVEVTINGSVYLMVAVLKA